MEEFRNIDWHPPLEDILDHVFIHEERMKKESVMYRIMYGTFVDPFEDIDDMEVGDVVEEEREKSNVVKSKPIKMKKQSDCIDKKEITAVKGKPYVPGIVKCAYKFPRLSRLTKEQQALCSRVTLRFSGSEKPEVTKSDRDELETYMKLLPLIREEQDEFLEFAKKKWDGTKLKVLSEDYINLRWKEKVQNVIKLPRYYIETGNIAFVADKEIGIKFESTLLEMGTIPRVILPTFKRPYFLSTDTVKLQSHFVGKDNVPLNSSVTSKMPVSQDLNCKRLVKDTGADLVISSSGLNCLVNNIGQNYKKSWVLPVLVKQENGKNVIYIDKPLPSTAKTVPEKNDWVYKYILRSHLVQFKHFTSIRLSEVNEGNCNYKNVVDNMRSDEYSNLEKMEDNLSSSNKRKVNSSIFTCNNENVQPEMQKVELDNGTVSIKSSLNDSSIALRNKNTERNEAMNEYVENRSNIIDDHPNSLNCEAVLENKLLSSNTDGQSNSIESVISKEDTNSEICNDRTNLQTSIRPPLKSTSLDLDRNEEASSCVNSINEYAVSNEQVNTSLDSIDEYIHLDKQNVMEGNEEKNSTKSCTDPMDEDLHKADKDLTNEAKADCLDPLVNSNVSYRLFSIGSSVAKNELMKNIAKDYKILVRSKIDGFEKLSRGVVQLVMLAPKLEHQVALGAEAVTLEEALKQWISLTFRPNTHLLRVRISATTSEVLQIEKRTTASINNEIKRLYKVKIEDSLTLLHNVIDTLTNASSGRYVIRHTVRDGAFATIYKETTRSGRNVFDLHTLYGDEQLHTIPNAPWPALDKVVVTPMLKCFEFMPAMFRPSKFNTSSSNNKKNIKKQKLRTVKAKEGKKKTGKK